MEKQCTACKEWRTVEDFYPHKMGKNGRTSQCKLCMQAFNKEWCKRNPIKRREAAKRYQMKYPDKIAEYRKKNRKRLTATNRQWKIDNPEAASLIYRRGNLKLKYGMTIEDYDNLLLEQNNRCPLCLITYDEHLATKGKRLVVDHNHDTGKVRGLLCTDCNRNLIRDRTDPEVFLRAAEYVRQDGTRKKI